MLRNRFAPVSFLSVGLLLVIGPMLAFAIASAMLSDDAVLTDTYYVIVHRWIALSFPAVSGVFALAYWVGMKGGLVFRPVLIWPHLTLWTLGSLLVCAPQFLTPVIQAHYSDDLAASFSPRHTISSIGYCVALLSAVIFGICIGDAILRRIRRGKAL